MRENLKDMRKNIMKMEKETNRKSTEAITIRVTKEEKKKIKRLAYTCGVSVTQLIKHLINRTELHAVPPEAYYETYDLLHMIYQAVIENIVAGEPITEEIEALKQGIETFNEHTKIFYHDSVFSDAYENYPYRREGETEPTEDEKDCEEM